MFHKLSDVSFYDINFGCCCCCCSDGTAPSAWSLWAPKTDADTDAAAQSACRSRFYLNGTHQRSFAGSVSPSPSPSMMAMMKLCRGFDSRLLFFFSYPLLMGAYSVDSKEKIWLKYGAALLFTSKK